MGEEIVLEGSATDSRDGRIGGDALSWTVLLHHDTHTHPFLGPVFGKRIPLTAPAPENLLAATNSYLEVRLTATDSAGLSATTVRELRPRLVALTFTTEPTGLSLAVNGDAIAAPHTLTSWEGYELEVIAETQERSSKTYRFVSWSDDGAAAHRIVTPGSPATYTAKYAER